MRNAKCPIILCLILTIQAYTNTALAESALISQALLNKFFPLGEKQSFQRNEITKFLRAPDNSQTPFPISYDVSDREFGIREKRIFEDSSVLDLTEGSYTFLITLDGHIVFGKVIDYWEFGVKHIHLANSRPVLVAGEMKINPNKSIQFNLDSGSFTVPIINAKHTTYEALEVAVIEIFREVFQVPSIEYTPGYTFIPSHPPIWEDLLKLCSASEFKARNAWICELYIRHEQ
jgi:hypothetical protein